MKTIEDSPIKATISFPIFISNLIFFFIIGEDIR